MTDTPIDAIAALRPRPCPFCGGLRGEHVTRHECIHYVRCETCNASTGATDSLDDAIAAWNRRDPAANAEVERLKATLQAVRDDALREAADAVDTGRMRDNPADAIRALIAAPDAKEPPDA